MTLQVLSETATPHKTFRRGTWLGVSLLIFLYIGVNIVYVSTTFRAFEVGMC